MTVTSPFLRTFLVLGGVTFLGPLAMDSSLPAFGAMQADLGVSAGVVKMTLAAVTAGMAAGQIVFGPMADRFGRRPILNLGLALFTIAALIIAFMDSAGPIIALRFVQGLGVSGVMIASRAVVRDQFDVATSARLYAYLLVVLGFVPVIGPIGFGLMTEAYGWRPIFISMAAISGAGWLVVFFALRETLEVPDYRALRLLDLFAAYRQILRDRYFAVHLVVGTGTYIVLFSILGGIAPVMMDVLGQTPVQFGWQFAGVLSANLIGASLVGKGIKYLGMRGVAALSVVIMALGAGLFAYFVATGQIFAISLLPSAFFALIGFGLINPVLIAGALTNFKSMAGRAGALFGLISLTVGAGAMFLLGALDDGTARPMAAALGFGGGLAALAYLFLMRPLGLSGEASKS
ncbi:MAG: Bcr/CflA family efflux MFS transporter [Rhodospirillaceae bacterium]|nr:Bcr/CflA family efflux MFS transporter [Rhodospirillaceae bacterium]